MSHPEPTAIASTASGDGAERVAQGEEFRDDLRPGPSPGPGTGNVAARRLLSADELAPLTRLNDARSLLAVGQTVGLITGALLVGWWGLQPVGGAGGALLVLAAVAVIGIAQHGLFILAHEAAHHRLLAHRGMNDALGRLIGMVSGISMCTYRVIHRLHHNHLYGPQDPDTAIHGGYPRGVAYLWKKLGLDLLGWNAWKTYAYFFGAPAIADDDGTAQRTTHSALNDTSPSLRAAARADRWWVLATQLLLPMAIGLLGGWSALGTYLLLWVLPLLTVLQPILRLRAICEHGAVDDIGSPLTAARSNRGGGNWLNHVGRWLLFPHHVNHHLEHHLYPAVPHYHLPRLHRLLRDKGVFDGTAEVRDLGETLIRIFAPRRPRPRPRPAFAAKDPLP
jgi:fatty acid desaturase